MFNSKIVHYQTIWLSILTSLLISTGCQKEVSIPPLKQDPFIKVYFNNERSRQAKYTEPYRHITRSGDNLEQIIVDAIASAKSSVDIAIQELRLPKIAQALAQRHQAGVKVRVILENNYSRPWSEFTQSEINRLNERALASYDEFFTLADRNRDSQLSSQEINEGDALVILQNAGVPIIDDTTDGSKGSALMHHKFIVVDGYDVIIASANFTPSDIHGDFAAPESRGNANNLLKIKDYTLASLFVEEFNIMWGDGPEGELNSQFGIDKPYREAQQFTIGESIVTVQFSPTSSRIPWNDSSNGLIGKTLKQATESIDLALFVFSEQRLADVLESLHQQDIEIRALIDSDFIFRSYSEALDMLGVTLSDRCKYETDNSPWQEPIDTVGVPRLPGGDKLHHKFGLIDKQIVIAGSHNWSVAANVNNDETVVIIENATVAAHFIREFERLYDEAVLGLPVYIREEIEQKQTDCS
jgi:phosphatidylserine/phosphatidylglycerophosphate/cardiolipin synthase-like enzyme